MTTATTPVISFDHADAERAHAEWACNCGPSAWAAILHKTLDEARPVFENDGFADKGYVSPTMMAQALTPYAVVTRNRLPLDKRICDADYLPQHGLARIQWAGPWTKPGSNPRWAYAHTHWIACWKDHGIVFDINGGLLTVAQWESVIVPVIVATIKRADGEWFVANSWEVAP